MKRSASGSAIKPSTADDGSSLHISATEGYNLINQPIDKDYICPICFNLIDEAYMTKCGHTFCYKCLKQSVEVTKKCTRCNTLLDSKNDFYPNFLMNKLILKQKKKLETMLSFSKKLKMDSFVSEWQSFLAGAEDGMHLADIDQMLKMLTDKRRRLQHESTEAHNKVLLEFLEEIHKQKQDILERLRTELNLVESDIKRVKEAMDTQTDAFVVPNHNEEDNVKKEQLVPKPSTSGGNNDQPCTSDNQKLDALTEKSPKTKEDKSWLHRTLAKRRCRLNAHLSDLQDCYFNTRLDEIAPTEERHVELLNDFSHKLKRFTQFSDIRSIAKLSYASDVLNQSSIVSSIDFDKDCDHFAVAGVTKKIKIYDYEAVINNSVDGVHCPIVQMSCNSKISCVSWSHYHKSSLASSDYEGCVTLWDAFAGQKKREFREHEKRCWSIDFNTMDPRILASGSDDAKVKLWSCGVPRSVGVIEAKANVCCVQFNPHIAYNLAFGCADHFVHYYDIRHTKRALDIYKGHKKAVSYAKFVGKEEIVSASTDSELRLWQAGTTPCIRSFRGHTNDKNFVGLATNGDYIACGSEDNSLYVYYKGLSSSLLTYKFNVVKSVLNRDINSDDGNEFISAVTWKAGTNILTAANSQGTIQILELV